MTGKVKNGVVVLSSEVKLPDGTEVEVTPLLSAKEAEDFTEEMLRISRITKSLPPDLAENHDYHLHGRRRTMIYFNTSYIVKCYLNEAGSNS